MPEKQIIIEEIPFPLAPITVVVGHYGVGKTNLSLNLAYDVRKSGRELTIIDLDVVNPYFRSSDYCAQLEAAGIRIITPIFAGTSLEVPSLSGAIEPALKAADDDHIVIIDAGGDDAGATALGRYAEAIKAHDYLMMYVVNAYRNLTQTPEEGGSILKEIEHTSHLKAGGIINNSHLKSETRLITVELSQHFAQACAHVMGLSLLATTVSANTGVAFNESSGARACSEPKSLAISSRVSLQKPYLVQVYVRTPWEQ